MPGLSISLLGPFQVTLDGRPITDFRTDKTRALLAYLAVESGRPHRRDALAGLLWPDAEQGTARRNLRQALSFLRQALEDGQPGACEPSPLHVTRDSIQFSASDGSQVDVAQFVAWMAATETHRHRIASGCLPCLTRAQQAVGLYRGAFLSEFFLSDSSPFEEWAWLQRERLHRHAIACLSRLALWEERRGNREQALQYAWTQIQLEPWREQAHRHLMRLLALKGDRTAALAQYETCRRILRQEFDTEPTALTTELRQQIEQGLPLESGTVPHHVPEPAAPIVGREHELAQLTEILADPDQRLVTLAGPGGIGKTRLAIEIALRHAGVYRDGVHMVPLAGVEQAEHVAPAVAGALKLALPEGEPESRIVDYYRGKEALLILDNLEHLPQARSFVQALSNRATGLTILITSRERLNLRHETVFEVRGLPYPSAENDPVRGSAVDLFCSCALRANPLFAPDDHDVARICRIVGGMPLGIELAAAWTAVHTCAEIADQIEKRLDILTTRVHDAPARHRSLRATYEHSWQLLSPPERRLLEGLSVFRSGFSVGAATAVAGATPLLLTRLLDKSLIHHAAPNRLEMHELLRQYTTERLVGLPDEMRRAYQAHAAYYAAWVEGELPKLRRAELSSAFQGVIDELENVKLAWHTSILNGQADQIDHMVDSIYHFCSVQGRFREGIELLGAVRARWQPDPQQRALLGRALSRLGALCRHLGDCRQAQEYLQRALALARELGQGGEQIFCLVHLANVARGEGAYARAEELARQALALSRTLEHVWGKAFALHLIALAQYRRGKLNQAEHLVRQGLDAGRESGDRRRTIAALSLLADISCHHGRYGEAETLFQESLDQSQALGDQFNAAVQLNNLGTIYHVQEDYQRAQEHYQQSLRICRQLGDRSGQAIALSNLGEVAFAMGAYRRAQRRYLESLAIGREIQDQWAVANCLRNLGEVCCVLGDRASARAHLAEAIQAARQGHIATAIPPTLVTLAGCLQRQERSLAAAHLLQIARSHKASDEATREQAGALLEKWGISEDAIEPQDMEAAIRQALDELTGPD